MEDIRNDQQVQIVEKNVPALITKAKSMEVKTELESKHANNLLLECKKYFKIAEDRRKFFVKPLQDHVKTINDLFKVITSPLKEVEAILKDKLLGWVRIEQARKAQEEKEKREITSSFLETDTSNVPVTVNEKPKVTIDSGLGKSFTKKVWKWKVADESKIPKEYWILDEKKINGLLRAHSKNVHGVASNDLKIDGIEVYQEDELSVRI